MLNFRIVYLALFSADFNYLDFKFEKKNMKYHIFQVFKTSIKFIKKSSDHFKDIYKLKFLTSFDVYMTSCLKGVPNYVLLLIHNSSKKCRQNDIKICQELQFIKIFKMIRGFLLKRSRSYKIMQNVIFHVKLLSPTLSYDYFSFGDFHA